MSSSFVFFKIQFIKVILVFLIIFYIIFKGLTKVHSMMSTEKQALEYAFPLNKRGRLFLKLDNLIEEIALAHQGKDHLSLKYVLQAVINILLLLERVDIKMELTKELERLGLCRHEMNQLNLFQLQGKFGESIRSKPLFSQLQKRLVQPGGMSTFDMPLLHTWLHLSFQTQQEQLDVLLREVRTLQQALKRLFSCYEQKQILQAVETENGFVTLNPEIESSILRIFIPEQYKSFIPEVSSSSRAVILKFWIQDSILDNPRPSNKPLSFHYTLV